MLTNACFPSGDLPECFWPGHSGCSEGISSGILDSTAVIQSNGSGSFKESSDLNTPFVLSDLTGENSVEVTDGVSHIASFQSGSENTEDTYSQTSETGGTSTEQTLASLSSSSENETDGTSVEQTVGEVPTIISRAIEIIPYGVFYRYSPLLENQTPVRWTLLSGPETMQIHSETGSLDWAPQLQDMGMHSISIQAANAAGKDTQSFTLQVVRCNECCQPVIQQICSDGITCDACVGAEIALLGECFQSENVLVVMSDQSGTMYPEVRTKKVNKDIVLYLSLTESACPIEGAYSITAIIYGMSSVAFSYTLDLCDQDCDGIQDDKDTCPLNPEPECAESQE